MRWRLRLSLLVLVLLCALGSFVLRPCIDRFYVWPAVLHKLNAIRATDDFSCWKDTARRFDPERVRSQVQQFDRGAAYTIEETIQERKCDARFEDGVWCFFQFFFLGIACLLAMARDRCVRWFVVACCMAGGIGLIVDHLARPTKTKPLLEDVTLYARTVEERKAYPYIPLAKIEFHEEYDDAVTRVYLLQSGNICCGTSLEAALARELSPEGAKRTVAAMPFLE